MIPNNPVVERVIDSISFKIYVYKVDRTGKVNQSPIPLMIQSESFRDSEDWILLLLRNMVNEKVIRETEI